MKALVVGCGSIGGRHLRNLKLLGVAERAVVEPHTARWESLDAEVVKFATLEEALRWKPALAVVATPTSLHVPAALALAEAGCHPFIEKPLSNTLDGVDALIRVIDARRLVSLVGCNMRFHPGPAGVKRLLKAGAVGRVVAARVQTGSYLPRWRPQQDYRASYSASPAEGGAVLDCIHELDLACWYSGPAALVSAAVLPAGPIGLETDGLAEILLRHASGALSSVHLNFIQRNYRRSCEIVGERGTVAWDFGAHRIDLFDETGDLAQSTPGPAGYDINGMYLDELAHFLACVRSGADTVNSVRAARGVTALALEVRGGAAPTVQAVPARKSTGPVPTTGAKRRRAAGRGRAAPVPQVR